MSGPFSIKDGPLFACIPQWILFHPTLSDKAIRVWGQFYFKAFQGRSDVLQVSYSQIARWLKLSERTVQRIIDELESAGALERGREVTNNGFQANSYVLCWGGVTDAGGDKNVTTLVTTKMSKPSSSIKEDKITRKRARNPIFEALCEESGIDWKNSNSAELGPINKATKVLKEMNPVPTEELIHLAASRYKSEWKDLDFSVTGLVKHWTRFSQKQIAGGGAAGPSKSEYDATCIAIYDEWKNSGQIQWTVPGSSVTMKTHPQFSGYDDPREKGET